MGGKRAQMQPRGLVQGDVADVEVQTVVVESVEDEVCADVAQVEVMR